MKSNPGPPSVPCSDLQERFAQEFVWQSEGPVLVVGSAIYPGRPDWRKRHPSGIGADMQDGEGVDVIVDLEAEALPVQFSHIECLSVLEHTQRPWKVADNLTWMLREGGSIFISVPWVWRFHGYPGDFWRFSHMTLPILFPTVEWKSVRYAVNGEFTESERSPKTDATGNLPKMELMAFGVKCRS